LKQVADVISVMCGNCGHEMRSEVGWLREHAARADFECPNCRENFSDFTKELELMCNDASGPNRILRLTPRDE
jgi:transposase-like protein